MAPLGPRDLLLAERTLDPQAVASILAPYAFEDPLRADAELQRIADEPQARSLLAEIVEELLAGVAASADADQALSLFERMSRAAVNRLQLLAYLKETPRTLELLARTFGASPFMAEILIRDPGDLYWLADPQVLDRNRLRQDRDRDLDERLAAMRTDDGRLAVLRRFKRRELLHLGVRDLMGLATVDETLVALSTLAETLIRAALAICERAELARAARSGADASRMLPHGFAVIGMGKLGGGELNFSSDVDLIYVSGDEENLDEIAAALSIPLGEYFARLARALTAALSAPTDEGYVYRVDLRLRPDGRAGRLVMPLSAVRDYYAARGATWERLALLKAWPVAGDPALGSEFLTTVEPFIYGPRFGDAARGDVRDMKTRIDRQVAERDEARTNVKLGLGGIREIEIVAQTLQLAFGDEHRGLRQRGTLPALAALAEAGFLAAADHRTLADAYRFLRDVENKLQMVHDVQSHALPADPKELRRCGLRLGYRDTPDLDAGQLLLRDHERHTAGVNALFRRLLAPSPDRP
jgi:glutamate-ammonia-ligase adenylyltransferase